MGQELTQQIEDLAKEDPKNRRRTTQRLETKIASQNHTEGIGANLGRSGHGTKNLNNNQAGRMNGDNTDLTPSRQKAPTFGKSSGQDIFADNQAENL